MYIYTFPFIKPKYADFFGYKFVFILFGSEVGSAKGNSVPLAGDTNIAFDTVLSTETSTKPRCSFFP